MRATIVVFVFLSLLCGIVYPLAVTGIAQGIAPGLASGSLVREGDRTLGSALIGQQFDHPAYVWGRPSATKTPYAPCQTDLSAGSSGSNLGPLHPDLRAAVAARVAALRDAAAAVGAPANGRVPVDLVTASGSGLDPHISPAAAEFQVERIARVRNQPAARVREVLATATCERQYGLLGEPVVAVLAANLALDRAFGKPVPR